MVAFFHKKHLCINVGRDMASATGAVTIDMHMAHASIRVMYSSIPNALIIIIVHAVITNDSLIVWVGYEN